MKKLAAESTGGGWTDASEFVYKGKVVRGSHLLELLNKKVENFCCNVEDGGQIGSQCGSFLRRHAPRKSGVLVFQKA